MTPEEIVTTCRDRGVRLVRFLYCDNGGVARAKAVHVAGLADRIRTGIGITVAMQAMNSLDQLQPVEGMGPVGEIRLVPDPGTFRILPACSWTPSGPCSRLPIWPCVARNGRRIRPWTRPSSSRTTS
jgi:glutamine synthetase